jgi:large subunit ribosomal protein L18
VASITENKFKTRLRRKKHIRKIVHGSAERPRLVVYRSERQVYAQLVDDVAGRTLTGVSSLSPDLREGVAKLKPMDVCRAVGEACARKALSLNINRVVFDRNGFPYHGRVKAVAEGARKGGLEF